MHSQGRRGAEGASGMKSPDFREQVFAGRFYPASRRELEETLGGLIRPRNPIDAIACLMPHAGYMYSGSVAGRTIARVNVTDTVILVGPNHTGYGAPLSIMARGRWQTPLGAVEIDGECAQALLDNSRHLKINASAHAHEHSLEVEVPFLQFLKPQVKIVPIVIGTDDQGLLKELATAIAAAVRSGGSARRALIAASSDMTHYEPQKIAAAKDRQAIDAITALDEAMLWRRVREFSISMCGVAPAAAMIAAARELGAQKGDLIAYQTSSDVTGEESSVVGYAGIVIY